MKNLLYFLVLLSITFASCNKTEQNKTPRPYIVMLSMDGFRWDYANKVETPNLDYIANNGVKAAYLKPCFPSKTFPNHYSIATGLYPDNHGIVNNTFFAPDLGESYWISNREAVTNPEFYSGEPIWVTAEKQGIITASYFWVGSEAPIKGYYPTYWKEYEHNFPYQQRIDSVMYWLDMDYSKRPNLITFYFDQPDSDGHKYGPDSNELKQRITDLDKYIGNILEGFSKLSIKDSINFIIVSDHGMGQTITNKVFALDEMINLEWCEMVLGSNPVYNIKAKREYYDRIYEMLSDIDHLTIWKNEEVPEEFHYGTNPRTLDFTVVADSAWSLIKSGQLNYPGGTHGYKNSNQDMYGIFYAIGPHFKKGFSVDGFENIHIYPLLCKLLNINAEKVDGNLAPTEAVLTTQSY